MFIVTRPGAASAADPTITSPRGTGEKGFAGDGGPAAKAKLDQPFDVAFDRAGQPLLLGHVQPPHPQGGREDRHHHHRRGQRQEGLRRRRREGDRREPERALRRRTRRRRQPLHRGPAELLHPQGGREDRRHLHRRGHRRQVRVTAATAGRRRRRCSSSRTASASTARGSSTSRTWPGTAFASSI